MDQTPEKVKPQQYNAKIAEKTWSEFWQKNNIYRFEKKGNIFSIDTPPPYPSGDFHAGNVLNWAYFDFIARYKRMQGFSVHFPQGWDVHGLPTESKVEKWKGKKSSEVPKDQWYKWCDEWTVSHIDGMKEMINRLAISVDWSFEFKTSDPEYVKMIQHSFLELMEKGYAYRGKHPINWCTNCLTAISDAEVDRLERNSKLYSIKFPLEGKGEIVIATSRPELLAACVTIIVNPKDDRYKEIVNRRARVPLFDHDVEILTSDTVDMEFGTGIMMVCTFGDKEDVSIVLKNKLPILDAIDERGCMTELVKKYHTMPVAVARKAIIEDLKTKGFIIGEQQILQRTGICWRCKNPIEILNKEQWFIRATQIKNQMIKETEAAKWHPAFMRIHQLQWTESLDWDWVVSRQKVYGSPIPVWYCSNDSCASIITPSIDELPIDPEKKEKKCPKCNSVAKPETDRFDTWFDSSMQNYWNAGWPDRKDDKRMGDWQDYIPASLQPNGQDIIRTWDYYLMLRSLMLTKVPAYENVLINGMVLGEDGRKMSKSLGNYVTAKDIFEKSSVDAVRYWTTTGATGNDIPFSWKELAHAEKFYVKLTNIVNFASMHINSAMEDSNIDHPSKLIKSTNDLEYLDKWMLSLLEKLVSDVTEDFEHYNFSLLKIEEFVWHELADYYLEMIKHRVFNNYKKEEAAFTLYTCLYTVTKLLAPFAPYVTEEIYKSFFEKFETSKSIHLTSWPEFSEELIDEKAEELGNSAKDIVSAIRQYKTSNKLPLNAPLKEVIIEDDSIIPLIEDLKGTLKIEDLQTGAVSDESIITKKGIKIKIIS